LAVLLAEVERRGAAVHETAMDSWAWLASTRQLSAKAAKALVGSAVALTARPVVAAALVEGRVSAEQAAVIVNGLKNVEPDLDPRQVQQVAETLVGFAADFGPSPLRRLVNHAVEVVAPELAEAADLRSVERAEREAHRTRFLDLKRDLDGALWIHGKLPTAVGEQFQQVITALAAKSRATDALVGVETTLGQACADGLATMLQVYSASGAAPVVGQDRPRIMVAVDYDTLLSGVGTATLVNSGERIPAREARRLACDAGILPIIMNGQSQPLDVGQEQRLFTHHLRAVLNRRDQGCAFPGCDRPPAACEAHHIKPWWAGGRTALSNAALLCPRHHHQIEPNPTVPPEQQWHLRLDHRGLPEWVSPTRRDGSRPIRQHHRFRDRPEALPS
jgi:hypothetical protein